MILENPYRHGAYHFTVATLILMGINKTHKFDAFVARFKKAWLKADAEGFKTFASKPARNEATARDLDGRIYQNCRVLQRTKDYGKPLLRAGAVIDLMRGDKGKLMICLNSKSKKPQKPGRAPRQQNDSDSRPSRTELRAIGKAVLKALTTSKPSKGKKRAQKRTVKATATNPNDSLAAQAVKAVTVDPTKAD